VIESFWGAGSGCNIANSVNCAVNSIVTRGCVVCAGSVCSVTNIGCARILVIAVLGCGKAKSSGCFTRVNGARVVSEVAVLECEQTSGGVVTGRNFTQVCGIWTAWWVKGASVRSATWFVAGVSTSASIGGLTSGIRTGRIASVGAAKIRSGTILWSLAAAHGGGRILHNLFAGVNSYNSGAINVSVLASGSRTGSNASGGFADVRRSAINCN
jgi:hypothetical protein